MDKHKFNGTIQDYFKSLSKRPEFFLKTKVSFFFSFLYMKYQITCFYEVNALKKI